VPKRGGIAGGKRPRLRADKPRRAGGGDIQVEPLPPQDPENYPGIIDPPIRGGYKPRTTRPYHQ
jgi:hypothetical protein